jgi:hypothetical protein
MLDNQEKQVGVDTIERTRIITIPEAVGAVEAAELKARDEATAANLKAHVNLLQISGSNPTDTADGFTPTTEHLVDDQIDVPAQPDAPAIPAPGLFDDLVPANGQSDLGEGEYLAVHTARPNVSKTDDKREIGWQMVGLAVEGTAKLGEIASKGLMTAIDMPDRIKRVGLTILAHGPFASGERVQQLKREHTIKRFQDTRPFVMQSRQQ